ncbi:death-associated protein kinase 2-like isoform X1 [Acropora millepora]|uniref:death-associated protein kinase 2-like isoform X1 n=1 Tax=Acropora millepora TaxID=45264 RepID=UPI0010FC6CD7|nr:death-associated protein kinase 2-like isoform X1 [Acropora millepora]
MELLRENPEKFYLFGEEIGRGKYAVVKSCMDKQRKENLAAKLIKYDEETENNAKQEFEIMKTFKHDRLLAAKNGYIVQKYVVIVMDRLENKELLDFLAEKTTASEEDASRVIAQLVETLNYLHTQNVVHLDVRPANILMSKEFKLTLIDYGNARKIMAPNGQMVDAVGVTEFTAPEVLNFEMTHWAADMWSVGVLLYILLSGKLPFTVEDSEPDDDIDEKIAAKVKAANVILKATDFRNATEEAENLIKRLLVRQPERRPTAVSCLDDPWLLPVLLTQKRKSSEIPTAKFKALNERLKQAEEDERVVASCVLRDFNEKAYESPDEEEE